MTRDDERLLRLKQQRSKEAIDLAMQARWQEAVEVNKEIIESYPEDVDACNRLGRAYMELGQYSLAREAYNRTIQMDPYNAIAARNLRRLSDLGESDEDDVETDTVDPHHFIEEIGKAGVVTLYELAPKENRARMVAGDKVVLKPEGSALVVENRRGVYMGKVDPKYAQRLVRLMLGGNQYTSSVVKSTMDMMTIIIRETYQHPSQVGKLSFPPRGMEEFRPYVGDKLLKVEDDEEEDESGYTIIGGDEIEVLPEESGGVDNDEDSDDE
ncbi:MAG: tetratricopeptide repeat protein [Dehalococcoidales bacterium]|nr:tetratricopeptide repeat protein [Dehalococcoidales bacterium]